MNPECPDLQRFLRGEIDAAAFPHREHVRMAYEMLRRHDFAETLLHFSRALRVMAEKAGKPQAFHQTITIAFLALIAERMQARTATDFAAFTSNDSLGARETNFSVPERYNASAILFDNLAAGRGERVAITGPGGTRTYRELCADAARFGNALLSLGLARGDRVPPLLFLDDTPAYPAALFGAIRAGLVPLLINTLTPPDLLQFFLADFLGARVAIADAGFADRFNSVACAGTALGALVVIGQPPSDTAVKHRQRSPGHHPDVERQQNLLPLRPR